MENIRRKIVFVGAEDDVLWDTCKYSRRMDQRLESMPDDSTYEQLLYAHGTHFVFPERMLKILFHLGSELLESWRFGLESNSLKSVVQRESILTRNRVVLSKPGEERWV